MEPSPGEVPLVDLVLVLVLLAAAVVMFVRDRPRMDVVALLMIAALPLTGVVTIDEALMGFADPNIVLIALLFVLGEGLVRTGVARDLGDLINARAGGSEVKLLVLLMVAVAGLGSIMSSTAVVAIFIPVVLRICRSTNTAPSRLMMPLSFAALISGMLTLVATAPNLVVHAELVRQGAAGFGFFSVTPMGLIVLVLAIGYILIARRFLPERLASAGERHRRPTFADWIEKYDLGAHEARVRVPARSPIVDKRRDELEARDAGVSLLAVERDGGALLRPSPTTRFAAGDVLLLDVRAAQETRDELVARYGVEVLPLAPRHRYLTDRTQDLGMTEAIVPEGSSLVGKSVGAVRPAGELGLTIIGLRRGQTVVDEGFLDTELRVGDTLLLTGFWRDLQALRRDGHDLVVLHMPAELDEVLPAAGRGRHALAILALVVALMVAGVLPNVHAVLLGCLLMGLAGCVDMKSAYRAINWQSLVLIVGMMPFSLALQRTGGVDIAADALVGAAGEGSPRIILAVIFAVTAILGMFISNTATAILMAPVALAIAADLGASPYPFALTVAIAASTAFVTPVSSPVNTLVFGPGNYAFADFVKIGAPFALIALVATVLVVPVLPYP